MAGMRQKKYEDWKIYLDTSRQIAINDKTKFPIPDLDVKQCWMGFGSDTHHTDEIFIKLQMCFKYICSYLL